MGFPFRRTANFVPKNGIARDDISMKVAANHNITSRFYLMTRY